MARIITVEHDHYGYDLEVEVINRAYADHVTVFLTTQEAARLVTRLLVAVADQHESGRARREELFSPYGERLLNEVLNGATRANRASLEGTV
jgi:hypothetical protein